MIGSIALFFVVLRELETRGEKFNCRKELAFMSRDYIRNKTRERARDWDWNHQFGSPLTDFISFLNTLRFLYRRLILTLLHATALLCLYISSCWITNCIATSSSSSGFNLYTHNILLMCITVPLNTFARFLLHKSYFQDWYEPGPNLTLTAPLFHTILKQYTQKQLNNTAGHYRSTMYGE